MHFPAVLALIAALSSLVLGAAFQPRASGRSHREMRFSRVSPYLPKIVPARTLAVGVKTEGEAVGKTRARCSAMPADPETPDRGQRSE